MSDSRRSPSSSSSSSGSSRSSSSDSDSRRHRRSEKKSRDRSASPDEKSKDQSAAIPERADVPAPQPAAADTSARADSAPAAAGSAAGTGEPGKMPLGRAGGAYVPPHRMREMQKQLTDKNSVAFQRMSWEALRKSINGLINKVNTTNIKNLIPDLFQENLIRGRGLLVRSIMKAQMASPAFTHVYAGLIAVVNTKLPEVGELLLRRVIMQFRRAYKRNDKAVSIACTRFIAQLVNQQVCHELVALQLLLVLLDKPTDDSVEVAVEFVKECGRILTELAPTGAHAMFERFRGILHEGQIDKRVQYLIEGLFAVRKNNWKDYPTVLPELDLVELDDQITHEMSLDENYDIQTDLNVFKVDPAFEEHEKQYAEIKKEILGDEEESGDEAAGDAEAEEEPAEEEKEPLQITDLTEADIIQLRRQIYLTIMSSVDFEECAHKLMKLKIQPGQEKEICQMILECCSQERTYLKFYGLLGERFCNIAKVYRDQFEELFGIQYATIHRYETNRLRNVARFFSHLFVTDAIEWDVFDLVKLTEEDTTSSSRIFIKNLFLEMSSMMGLAKLKARLEAPEYQASFAGLFPTDNPKNTRFAINFFTHIRLGALTAGLRQHLAQAPKNIMQAAPVAAASDSDSDSDSDSSSGSDSDSDSDSSDSSGSSSSSSDDEDEKRDKKKKDSKKDDKKSSKDTPSSSRSARIKSEPIDEDPASRSEGLSKARARRRSSSHSPDPRDSRETQKRVKTEDSRAPPAGNDSRDRDRDRERNRDRDDRSRRDRSRSPDRRRDDRDRDRDRDRERERRDREPERSERDRDRDRPRDDRDRDRYRDRDDRDRRR